jgi:hypothetical protein
MSNQGERVFAKDEEIRIHALNLAASTYREVFRITREGEEPPALADQVIADARKYAEFIGGVDIEGTAEPHRTGYARAVARLRDEDAYRSWWTARDYPPEQQYWRAEARGHLADYLETVERPLPGDQDRSDTRA